MAVATRRRKCVLIGLGMALAIFGIAFPLFRWYVLMHATCEPSNDLCGLENVYIFLFLSIPCLLFGLLLILIGLLVTDRPRERLYWSASLSLAFGISAEVARLILHVESMTGGNLWMLLALTSTIASLLALIGASVSMVMTMELGWWKGRLLSVIALTVGVILLLQLLLTGP